MVLALNFGASLMFLVSVFFFFFCVCFSIRIGLEKVVDVEYCGMIFTNE